ncbi:Hypothetical_protein [Hexamita inflata]|uniref:Hypothetical_protein n=1 Tax=Hexamita inflata TaxID=28002 RepID=A0AA86RLJ0_9EUKA|nr:Hypothetical protein HINF_LOCUS66567 [Hexamita inflata]CAI9978925.1 Hypothetical protein HINF_LOCUS66570 [Hexamita inflata]CAI9978937.1 Hypothetical protein HINF_LOCUS66582 [Hexamita inflata]
MQRCLQNARMRAVSQSVQFNFIKYSIYYYIHYSIQKIKIYLQPNFRSPRKPTYPPVLNLSFSSIWTRPVQYYILSILLRKYMCRQFPMSIKCRIYDDICAVYSTPILFSQVEIQLIGRVANVSGPYSKMHKWVIDFGGVICVLGLVITLFICECRILQCFSRLAILLSPRTNT